MSSRRRPSWRPLLLPMLMAAIVAVPVHAQGRLTTPRESFGHEIGEDYWLPTYDQFAAFWRKLDSESNRMQVIEIGRTGEGRPQLAAIITAPENFARLNRYKEISQRLHHARGIDSAEARALAKEGKTVVWIDGGLHATEVLGANQLIETSWQLASRNDEETQRILRDVITVMVHANPDGMQMVAKCYMQNPVKEQRTTCSPRLYQRWAGHDNNRDSYMANTNESQNMNKLMYWEWLPQIMYNHHQTGPAGTVMFSPPFRDPFNYNFDPMISTGLEMVGAAMHQRFLAENKPGFTMRSGANYSTWWNGGLRTTAYFQNIIGILTETIGNPTPMRIPVVMNQILPRNDLPAPIEPQPWHFRQSIDYSVTANYAILDLASRYKDQLLYNIWKMGSNQIARGSRDHWTISNEDMVRADSALRASAGGAAGRGGAGAGDVPGGGRGRGGPTLTQEQYNAVFKNPAKRDPRVFVIPANQPDFATATKFINSLRYVGVEVNQATAPLSVNGKTYPAGSYVVKAAQAGRAHVIDMFMPQDHPNDMDERGIPRRPYDNAGWTLALQMGVRFDSVYTDVTGPMTLISGLAKPVAGTVTQGSAGYLLSPMQNDAFTVANRVLKANGEVYRLRNPMTANGRTYGPGSFYIVASGTSTPIIQNAATELGVNADGTAARPDASAKKYTARRVGLLDTQTGSMPSGWTRLILERFEFPFTVVCGAGFDDSNLRAKYDVIVVPSGTNLGPATGGGRGGAGGGRGGAGAGPAATPSDPDLRSLCEVTSGTGTGATTAENVRKFVEEGGLIVAAGSSSRGVGTMFGLPMSNYLVDREPGEMDVALGSDKFYVPGSVVRVAVDSTTSAAYGSQGHIDVFFDNSPVFRLAPDATMRGVRPVMWFDSRTPLRSGWAWGQNFLEGGVAAVEASVGRGRLYLYGPEITFRAQPHGTFKFLFNGIYGE
ncbi:MAG TPA: M14 metallopeptidase family protein [Gemmatimonadaceae bacterium]|nr:M14 metallopeptidase family protein [Gemmatimonadaceae bacterium]